MTLVVRAFRATDTAAFRDLNFAWIEAFFEIEDKDREILENPEREIIAPGGAIFVAEDRSRVVGCVAMLVARANGFELAKMAVDPSAQGQGAGLALIEASIAFARSKQADHIWLESNARLAPALRLYRRAGFVDGDPAYLENSPYSRCDVHMIFKL
jgi:GNAT superfamily N-acetyltransferase